MEDASTVRLGSIRLGKLGPVWTAILMSFPLYHLLGLTTTIGISPIGLIKYLYSGELAKDLAAPFDKIHAGFCLDQPTIGKFLFWFTVCAVAAMVYVAFVRYISDRTNLKCQPVFSLMTVAVWLLLFTLLLPPFVWLKQYVHSMGWTPARSQGLIYIACSCGVMLIYLCWAIWPASRTRTQSTEENTNG